MEQSSKARFPRLARKEIRGETQQLKKQVAHYRAELAALVKRQGELEKQLRTQSRATRPTQVAEEGLPGKALRFSASGLAKQRQRLGLSARVMGDLMGVSALSVYAWETGKTRPRRSQLAKIAEVRKLGKREVMARLERAARR